METFRKKNGEIWRPRLDDILNALRDQGVIMRHKGYICHPHKIRTENPHKIRTENIDCKDRRCAGYVMELFFEGKSMRNSLIHWTQDKKYWRRDVKNLIMVLTQEIGGMLDNPVLRYCVD